MSAGARADAAACASCLRRRWLLGELSAVLDLSCRGDGRLQALLALSDGDLIGALGGRRRAELRRRHAEFAPHRDRDGDDAPAICRHDGRYPRSLLHPAAPHLLAVAGGGPQRLHALTNAPVVAVLGTARATDYGRELARGLGRELSASGVTVAATGGGGIAHAARAGVLDAEGAALAVAGDGLGVRRSAARRAERQRLQRRGCTLAELPHEAHGRRWGASAAERTVASLADVAIVVEAEQSPRALAAARLARELGRTVAACPGRVTSPASAGSHELLREGARLVRDTGEVLELLHETGARGGLRAPACEDAGTDREASARACSPAPLAPRLCKVLQLIGAGVDTPGKLVAGSADPGELLGTLGELESLGLLRRGDGGRYVPCEARPGRAVRYGPATQMES